MKKSTRTPRTGFTLVELLVVIGIIALLISILLPTLSSAMSSARGVRCANNLRQQALSMHQYALDEDGWFPQSTAKGRWALGGMSSSPITDPLPVRFKEPAAQALLYVGEYIDEVDLFYCPDKAAGVIRRDQIPVYREKFENADYRNLFVNYPMWSNYRAAQFSPENNVLIERGELISDRNNQSGANIIVSDAVAVHTTDGYDPWTNHVEDGAYVDSVTGNTFQAKPLGGRIGRADGSVIFEYFPDLELRYSAPQGNVRFFF